MSDYIFVSGCPRSGTTVLAHILNWAPNCFIGLERYGRLFDATPDIFVPELFNRDRLMHFDAGDCFYSSYETKPEYKDWYVSPNIIQNLPDARVLGDKIVTLWRNFDIFNDTAWGQSNVTVFHIVRNVFDVASSYQSRLKDSNDGWSADFKTGVADWQSSVLSTYDFLSLSQSNNNSNVSVYIIDYDRLFGGDIDRFFKSVRAIYRKAFLDFGAQQLRGLMKIFEASGHRGAMRQSHGELRNEIFNLLSEDANEKYKKLLESSIV